MANTAVDLVVRFTTSEQDLVIHIDSAQSTTPLSVKQRIREAAPSSISGARLRLIYAGRVLPDTTGLSKCITIPPPPPPASSSNAQGKGKARVTSPFGARYSRLIINCSVGDTLTPAELAAESEASEAADLALLQGTAHATSTTTPEATSQSDDARDSTRTAPEPRGFDRLLSQGFNAAAVAEMRAQYLQILSHTHTPDTMPSGDELRTLEDRWLDNNNASTGGGADGGGEMEDGSLEDMLWGNIIGFFWPVAMLIWFREEGMWTRRRKISVLTGVLVNLTFGFLRTTN